MRSFVAIALLLPVIRAQIYENELPVSLQPPPPQPQPKSDFGSIIIPDIQLPDTSSPIQQVQPVQRLAPPPPASLPHIPTSFQQSNPSSSISTERIAHHTVLQAAEQEAKLPLNLLNPFYKNPRIAEQLAKSSWIEPGENLVGDRDSEKISRNKIYYALKSAGLIRRRR